MRRRHVLELGILEQLGREHGLVQGQVVGEFARQWRQQWQSLPVAAAVAWGSRRSVRGPVGQTTSEYRLDC